MPHDFELCFWCCAGFSQCLYISDWGHDVHKAMGTINSMVSWHLDPDWNVLAGFCLFCCVFRHDEGRYEIQSHLFMCSAYFCSVCYGFQVVKRKWIRFILAVVWSEKLELFVHKIYFTFVVLSTPALIKKCNNLLKLHILLRGPPWILGSLLFCLLQSALECWKRTCMKFVFILEKYSP